MNKETGNETDLLDVFVMHGIKPLYVEVPLLFDCPGGDSNKDKDHDATDPPRGPHDSVQHVTFALSMSPFR